MRLFSAKPEKNTLISREYSFSGFIPYLYHLDNNIVYTKKNQLLQVKKDGHLKKKRDKQNMKL